MLLDFTREAGTTLFSGCNNGIRSREKILVDSSLDKLEVKALRGQLITSSFFLGCAQEGLYSGKVILHPDVSQLMRNLKLLLLLVSDLDLVYMCLSSHSIQIIISSLI
jgi:hypothetical protein